MSDRERTVLEQLIALIKEQSEAIKELRTELNELKQEREAKPVITSTLDREEARRIEELRSPGMQKAIDKVLQDWERVKERLG